MPPHCDSIDGPVVKAAMNALDTHDVGAILPFVPEEGEAEVTEAFEKVMRVRTRSPEVKEVASGKGVKEAREYVEAMLGLEVYSHKLYECAHAESHGRGF